MKKPIIINLNDMAKPSKSSHSERIIEFNRLTGKIKVRLPGDKVLLLYLDEITYFIASGKYAYIHTTLEINRELVFHSLANLEQLLPKSAFVRAGRRHLLNLAYVHKIDIRKGICTMRVDKNNIFEINDLSNRAIKAIITNDSLQVSI